MTQDPGATGTPNGNRRFPRIGVLKGAKIILGNPGRSDSIIDCAIVNSSPAGVRVRTAVMADIPEWVTLQFSDGTAVRAHRRWARGVQIGFEITAPDR